MNKQLNKLLCLSITFSLLTTFLIGTTSAYAYFDVVVSYAGQGDKSEDAIRLTCRVDECSELAGYIDLENNQGSILDLIEDLFEIIEERLIREERPRQQYIGSFTSDSHIKLEMNYGGYIDPFIAPIYSRGAPSFTPLDWDGTRLFTTKMEAEDGNIVIVGRFKDAQVIGFQALAAQSNGRPHIARFKSEVYVTYNGRYSRGIYVARGTMGGSFIHKRLPGESASAPTLVEFKNRLYIFYRGHQSKYLYYTSSSDGVNWAAEQRINKTWETTHSPYPAVMGDRLYLAYKGGSTNYISMTSTSDGVSWQAEHRLPTSIKTDKGPALATHNGEMFLFFKGTSSDRVLYSSSLDGGVTWSSWQETGAHTSESLSAVSGYVVSGPIDSPPPPPPPPAPIDPCLESPTICW